MKYPFCPGCREARAVKWNGVICRSCGHDVSAYDPSVLPGFDPATFIDRDVCERDGCEEPTTWVEQSYCQMECYVSDRQEGRVDVA